jgi:hypothetical protein
LLLVVALIIMLIVSMISAERPMPSRSQTASPAKTAGNALKGRL